MDLMDMAPAFGEFDYIVAHGLYSWVPPAVRDKLMEVCRDSLAPHGVAYVSYNAYPGCHLRRVARDIMLYHTAGVSDPAERVRQARALMGLLVEAQSDAGMAAEFQVVLEREPNVIYHDDLAEFNQPVYFHEFAAHARRFGLQFLSEATLVAPEGRLPAKVQKALEPLDADPLRKEQYLDFMKVRRFRETLLCREDAPIARPVTPDRVAGLLASSKAAPAGPEEPGGAVEYVGEQGAAVKTVHPLVKSALTLLGGAWPRRMSFEEILAQTSAGGQHAALAEILWHTCRSGLVELHAHRGCFAARAGEYPVASSLARHDLREGNLTATLAHGVVQIDDPMGRRLVTALDGTRNRGALALELDTPLSAVEDGLGRLARLPLLLA
jgi:SAM-dependent methyltransferase